MTDNGVISVNCKDGISTIQFAHPKSNSLPGKLLGDLADAVNQAGVDPKTNVIVLRSEGERAFCAGASFEELLSVDSSESGKEFFMGFAKVILAMKNCPKFIVTRVQGKAVGGGVGIIAASDYVLATSAASIKLSELALGIGPFVIGPCVERRVGASAFQTLSIDTEWRDASWCNENGLYSRVCESISEVDKAVQALAIKLAASSQEAMAELKAVFWEGTESWEKLLTERAERSGKLVRSEFAVKAIQAAKKS